MRTPECVTYPIGPLRRAINAPICMGGEPEPLQHLNRAKKVPSAICSSARHLQSTTVRTCAPSGSSVAHTHPRDWLQPLEAAPGDYRGVRSASPTFELRPRIGRVSRVHLRKLGKAHSGPQSLIHYPKRVPPAPRAGVTNEPAPGGEKGRRALLLSMESSYGQIN